MSGVIKSHKDLLVWQKAIDLVEDIYKLTKCFPKDEVYGLISQIKRAAVSIPSNIAEGSARKSKKELIQFLYISLGSAVELETHIIISKRLEFIHELVILEKISEINRMLLGLIASIKKSNKYN